MGDRFIVREVGRRAVVAGGRVLDPTPPPRSRDALAAIVELEEALGAHPDILATALLDVHGRDSLRSLAAASGGGRPAAGLIAGDLAWSAAAAARLRSEALNLVHEYHLANPLRPGMPKASLASSLGVDQNTIEASIAASRELHDSGAVVAAAGFESALAPDEEDAWKRAAEELRTAGLAVPRLKELSLDEEVVHALLRRGLLVRVSDDFAYLPEQLEGLVARLGALETPFTVARFRDAFGISRKYAIPLLEWLDAQGVTHREGDLRTLRRS
jgi:selenocysteine-specific elongation factor